MRHHLVCARICPWPSKLSGILIDFTNRPQAVLNGSRLWPVSLWELTAKPPPPISLVVTDEICSLTEMARCTRWVRDFATSKATSELAHSMMYAHGRLAP